MRPVRATRGWLAIGLIGVLVATGAAGQPGSLLEGRRTGRFADGGVYVDGNRWGGTLNHMRVALETEINGRLAAAKKDGCLNVVQLEGENNWRTDPAQAAAHLSAWLKRTDMAKIDVLILGEEQAYDAARYLDPLYEVIKKECDVPVYVWPSSPLGPLGKADGYAYDHYGARYTDFRRKVTEFLRTGKPVVFCVDGSGYSDIISAREQVMVCREFDIPAFFFLADSGSGGVNGWMAGGAVYARWRNFVFSAMEFQHRSAGALPLAAGDLVWGEPIELAGDYEGRVAYSWTGVGPATVFGFQRLAIDATGVRARDRGEVACDYQFWSMLPLENARLSLPRSASDAQRPAPWKIELSRCGKANEWRAIAAASDVGGKTVYELGSPGREFRIRLTLPGHSSARFEGGVLSGKVTVPEDHATDLGLFVDGWRSGVRYRQDLGAGLWKTTGVVDAPAALEPEGLALRGVAGGVSASVIQKFTSQKPLSQIVVRLTGSSNERNLGGTFSLGVSLDGKKILAQGKRGNEPVSPDGTYRGTYTADLSKAADFTGIKTFYVHLGQVNRSGLRTSVSSQLERLEIDAAVGQ